jgi:methyl-accepting chemotaxis protein
LEQKQMTLRNLSVRAQLLGLSAFFLVMLVLVSSIGVYMLRLKAQDMSGMYQNRVVPLKQLKLVSDAYAIHVVDIAHKVRDGAVTEEQGLKSVADAKLKIKQHWADYTSKALAEPEKLLIEKFAAQRAKADAAVDKLEAVLKSGEQALLIEYAAKDMYPAIDPLQAVLIQLMQLQLDEARATHEAGEAAYQRTVVAVVLFVALALVIGLLLAALVTRQITRALGAEPHQLKKVAEAVGRGELYHEVNLRPGDAESVLATFARMRDMLREISQRVRGNAEGVATGSAQIAQGNSDLSSRTDEQATALEETAASMEQLGTTVKQNADNARQANQLALSASVVASKGGEVVGQVVDTMKGINDSSKRIADIISVIDGIAFQTNILALNAAVEAARAGEQGRGFAVVASEVRSLAQRSANAAKEIKALITASVERVDQGTSLVDQAGETMAEVVSSIRRVTDIMGEISSASVQQSAGVTQVGEAVTRMDHATQKNASLVQESAAAAESLRAQAQQLVEAVAVFKLA